MSATDELRRMLDERGVHWWTGEDERKTLWESSGLTWEYFNNENGDAWLGFLSACEQDIAPEQAIAATLGDAFTREECEASFVHGYSLGTLPVGSDPQLDENRQTDAYMRGYFEGRRSWRNVRETCEDVSENPLRFECSACGGLSLDIAPRYCPACGAEVKLHHGERRAD